MRKTTISARLLFTVAILTMGATTAAAQTTANYPSRVVRIVLPYVPGGSGTVIARTFADKFSKDLGQNFIVDNRPGGNTIIGTEAAAHAAPDGYTLLATTAALIVNQWTQPSLSYDALRDLTGVSTLIWGDHMFAVNPSVPANNLRELIAYLKKNPGKVNSYTSGLGTNNHLENLLFMQLTDTKYTVVPYKGGGAAISDLLSGNLQMALNTPSLFAPYIKAGKLRGIATSGEKRNAIIPDVPTFAELGLKEFVAGTWYTLLAPAATPKDIVQKLNELTARAQASADVQAVLAKQGISPYPNSVGATNAMLRSEMETWGKVIRANDFKAAEE